MRWRIWFTPCKAKDSKLFALNFWTRPFRDLVFPFKHNGPPLPWTKLSKEIFPVESVSHWAWAVATNTLHMQLKLQLETHETGQRHKSQDAKTSSSSCHEDCSVILAWSFLIFTIEIRKILRVYFKSDCGRIAIHLQLESILCRNRPQDLLFKASDHRDLAHLALHTGFLEHNDRHWGQY